MRSGSNPFTRGLVPTRPSHQPRGNGLLMVGSGAGAAEYGVPSTGGGIRGELLGLNQSTQTLTALSA